MPISTPNDLPNCVAWFDASDVTTLFQTASAARTNLLQYSDDLSLGWSKTQTTVVPTIPLLTPFNSLTSNKVFETAVSSDHSVFQTFSNYTLAATTTFSIYARQAERQFIALSFQNGTNAINTYSAIFDIAPGTAAVSATRATGTAALSSAIITNAGNGWYRCSITGSNGSSGTGTVYPVFGISDIANYTNSFNGHYPRYTGDSLSGVFVCGAQLENSTAPTSYIYSGWIPNIAPVPLSGAGSPNAIAYTENLNTGWTKANTTTTLTSIASPIVSNLSAWKISENTVSSWHAAYPTVNSVSLATPLTFSVYAKSAERPFIQLTVDGGSGTNGFSTIFDLTAGSIPPSATKVTGTGILSSSTITPIVSGWYRCTITGTIASSNYGSANPVVSLTERTNYTGSLFNNFYQQYAGANNTNGVLVWGPQHEYSLTATPYVSSDATAFTGPITYSPVTENTAIGYWGNKSLNANSFNLSALTNVGGNNNSSAVTLGHNGTKPVYKTSVQNNRSVLRFYGSNYLTAYVPSTVLSGETVFVVGTNGTNPSGWDRHFVQGTTNFYDSTSPGHYMPVVRASTLQAFASYTNSNYRCEINVRDPLAFNIFTSSHNGSLIQTYLNGLPSGSIVSHVLSGLSINAFRAGWWTAPTSNTQADSWFKGDIAEIIVYNRFLTPRERQDVEYYLARKWNLPRVLQAIQSSDWYSSSTWSVSGEPSPWNIPVSTDLVYSGAFTPIISADISAYGLRNTYTTSVITLSGGSFNVTQPVNIIVPLSGIQAGNTNGIIDNASTGTLSVTGNVTGGASIGANGILNSTGGNISIIGNVTAGTNDDANGINALICNNVSVSGNITGGSSGARTSGLVVGSSTGFISVTGNVIGGNSTGNNCYGILNNSSQTVNIRGNVTGGGNNNGVYFNVGLNHGTTGTVSITGNATGGFSSTGLSYSNGIDLTDNANLIVFGNVAGGYNNNTNCYGIYNQKDGNITVYGNVSAIGTAGIWNANNGTVTCFSNDIVGATNGTTNPYAIYNGNLGALYINSRIIRGGTSTNGRAIYNNSTASIYVTGNIIGGSGSSSEGIYENSAGALFVVGDLSASANASAITSGRGQTELCSRLISHFNGRLAVAGSRFLLKPVPLNSFTRVASSGTGSFVDFYAANSYSASMQPPISSVVAGVEYAYIKPDLTVSQLKGTMVLPSIYVTEYNTPISTVLGAGLVNARSLEKLWNTNPGNTKSPNSIGMRVSNTATMQELGNLLAYGIAGSVPNNISGLQLWLDSTTGVLDSLGNAATTNGTPIVTWQDQSGNNRHATQPTANLRPTLLTSSLGGRDSIRFNGSMWLRGISFPNLTNYTMFVVYRRNSTPSSNTGFVFCTGVDGSSTDTQRLTQLVYHNAAVPVPGYDAFGWTPKITSLNTIDLHLVRNNDFNIHSCTASLSIGSAEYRLDTSSAVTAKSFTPISTALGTLIYTLGNKTWAQSDTSYIANCDIAEVIVYDSVLSSSNRLAIELYLNSKWGNFV